MKIEDRKVRKKTGGLKFELTVQFLSAPFLQYLAEDIAHVNLAFDLTPNACVKLQCEVIKELERYGISTKRPTIKKLLGTI